jgi:hypothetical protein
VTCGFTVLLGMEKIDCNFAVVDVFTLTQSMGIAEGSYGC